MPVNHRGEILVASNLTKSFREMCVLSDVSLSLKRGEFACLVGPSGCGKTTLVRILAGLDRDYSGRIAFDLVDPSRPASSLVFQSSPLFPWLTVFENLTICMNNGIDGEKEKRERALNALRDVELLDFRDYYPAEISGGMVQRVNIARAFLSGSEVIFMDEPFVHLDFLLRNSLQKLTLDILEKEKRTILFVTHNIHEAVILGDRILIMSARPGTIMREFATGLSRPRDIDEIRGDARYLGLVKEITSIISVENRKSQQQLNACIKERHSKI